jgi:copper chaperone
VVAARLQGIHDAVARPTIEHANSLKLSIMGMSREVLWNTLHAAGAATWALDPTTVARSTMASPTSQGTPVLELTLPTMTCGHCVSVVTKAIKQTDPQAVVEIDLGSHRVRVDTTEDRETIAAAVAEAGYVPD